MADSERENAVERPSAQRLDESLQAAPRPASDERVSADRACAECGCPSLTLVKDAELVAIYKCPACGHLTAPVKNR